MRNTKVFAVAGDPVLHSMSPPMFHAAFKARKIDAVYTRIAASRAEDIMKSAKEAGITGINITSPFKEEIVRFVDVVDDDAQKLGAVNTIVMRGGRFYGYNTDIAGVANAFSVANVEITGRKAAVIGVGGAAKAVVTALLSEGAHVVIVNRTFEKAEKIAEELECKAASLEDIDVVMEGLDILVSCVPFFDRIIKPDLMKRGLVVLDANYSVESFLAEDAKKKGCKVIDSREWLLFQGARAFKHFTGMEPPLPAMRRALYTKKPTGKKNIALVGFMGAGKSTVAYGISEKQAIPFVEIDGEIEQKTGLSIREIFKTRGEGVFRKLESEELKRIGDISHTIISCGGGAVLKKRNRDILKANCIVVWLWAGIETLLQRTGNDDTRPLLNRMQKKQTIKKLLKERLPLYASVSDMLVRTDGKTTEEIVRKIYEETSKFLENQRHA